MPVTIKVNGIANSLVHKGASHSSPCTMPDVCKTPSPGGPVPIPYPNVSQSSSLTKGSTSVKADGGNMIAIKGSEYAMSVGDEPGTAGGVKSSTFKKESTWITYSFDVKIDGKNACRLTDKKFQNHENTVDLAGDLGPAVVPQEVEAELREKCGKLRASILEQYGKLGKEMRKYDPVSDAKGGFRSHVGGITKPGGHYEKIRAYQRGLRRRIKKFDEECSSSGVKVDKKVREAAVREIPPPPGFPRIPITIS